MTYSANNGLALLVTPLWRHFARDSVGADIGGDEVDLAAREQCRARWRVRRIRRRVEKANGRPAHWKDEGQTAFVERVEEGFFEPLRAFNRWLAYRDYFPVLEAPDEGGYERHPVHAVAEREGRELPLAHMRIAAYYLPADFDAPAVVETRRAHGRTLITWAASAPVGIRELAELHDAIDAARREGCVSRAQFDELLWPAADLMRRGLTAACTAGLPLIVWE